MNIAVCDDNTIQLEFITNSVINYTKRYNNCTVTSFHPLRLLEKIKSKDFPFNLIIIDIDLGDLNGVEIAQQINQVNPGCNIIFISYNINFATSIFDAKHIYFVLKTQLEERLPKAIDKAHLLYTDNANKYLFIQYQGEKFTIPTSDILYIEALARYLYVHTQNMTYKYIDTLKQISNKVPIYFVKSHKSYFINLSYIQSFNQSTCILKNNIQVPISRSSYKCFKQQYFNYIASMI